MKGSLSFDSNNAIFAQNIHEGMVHVKSYIRPKSVQKLAENQFFFRRGWSILNSCSVCFS